MTQVATTTNAALQKRIVQICQNVLTTRMAILETLDILQALGITWKPEDAETTGVVADETLASTIQAFQALLDMYSSEFRPIITRMADYGNEYPKTT